MELPVLALADDLTGALETGAQFAERRMPTLVTTCSGAGDCYSVLVVDTNSRHCAPRDAAAAVSRAVKTSCTSRSHILFKKTDSTLRGNIVAELRALHEAFPDRPIAYVPAYPAMGRTVRGGQLYVHGTPLHQTAFASDPLNPITDSSIVNLIGDLPCTVYDGETDEEVEAATASALGCGGKTVLVGPASVARALAMALGGSGDLPRWPEVTTCLLVNGSLHETSTRQMALAEADCCDESWRILPRAPGAGLAPLEVAAATGIAVRQVVDSTSPRALMVFGGDTAFAILQALGCSALEPIGEVLRGVPVSRVVGRDLIMITKAGGFGSESLVLQIRRILDANYRQ
jgi:uncharacterized protein YgbK (DUF1537 family)